MKRFLSLIILSLGIGNITADGILPYPGYWQPAGGTNAVNFHLSGRAISGLELSSEDCKMACFAAQQELIPARRGDFAASVDLIYDQYDGFFCGEVLFRILDKNNALIAEGGLRDRWADAQGLGKSYGATIPESSSQSSAKLPVKGKLALKFKRQGSKITVYGNGVKLAEKSGNMAPAAKIEIFYQEYRGEKNHSGSFEFANIKIKNSDTTYQNGFDDVIYGSLPPAWRLTRRVGCSGFEVSDRRPGMEIVGLKDFPGYPAKESTHVFRRNIKPLKGDFTATMDMAWELPEDDSFVGSISLALLNSKGQIIALTSLGNGKPGERSRVTASVGNQKIPGIIVPDKDAKEFVIRRTGDKIDIFCGAWQLEGITGSTEDVCTVQLAIWIARRYDNKKNLLSSFCKKLTLRRLALIDRALPPPEPAVKPVRRGKVWQLGKPVIWYWAGPKITDEFAAELAHGNWNTAWGFSVADLDILHKYNMRGMLWMSIFPANEDHKRRLKFWIESVRNHPAFFGIYLADEPASGKRLDDLKKVADWIRSEFPGVMLYVNMHPLGTDKKFLGGNGTPRENYSSYMHEVMSKVDPELMSYDKYTFATYGDESGYFVNLRMFRDLALQLNKPFMNIVQACTWTNGRRLVRGDEYRFLAYTTLAYGSQGLSCYVYSHPTHRGGMKDPVSGQVTGLYRQAREINREFCAIAGELQKLRPLQVYHAGEVPFMGDALPEDAPFNLEPQVKSYSDGKEEALEPKADGKNYLSWSKPIEGYLLGYFGKDDTPTHVLLVNLDYNSPRSITLTAPGDIEYFEVFQQSYHAAGGNKLKLTLPPGGGKLIRLKP